ESPSPVVAGHAVGNSQEALTPETIETILADLRTWLQQVAAAPPAPPPRTTEPFDLHTLLEQFIALRHEVNLQTKAVPAQNEQNAETLRQLGEALDLFHRTPAVPDTATQPSNEELLRPLLKTLVDLYDALHLAAREVQRVHETVLPILDQLGGGDDAP